jgi:hypothetical protein
MTTERTTPDDDEQPTTTRRHTLAAIGALPLGGALVAGAAAGESTEGDANPHP